MEDKELIELAAKACGFGDQDGNFIWTESEYPRGSKTNGALWNYMGWCDTAQLWNPLTDDGDALRLAVKLQMRVHVGTGATSITTAATENHGREPVLAVVRNVNDDPCAATRRAIVRAAAAIGEAMP